MADETLEWNLKIDADTEGAARMDAALGRIENQLEQVNRQLIRTELASGRAGKAHEDHAKKADGMRGAFDRLIHQGMEPFLHKAKEIAEFEFIREGTEELLHLPVELAEKIADLGREMISAAAQAERFDAAFSNALGKKEGGEVLEYIEKIGKHTEFTQQQLKGMSLELAKAGFKGGGLGRGMEALIDLASMSANPQEGASRALSALARVQATGKLEARALVPFGISEQALMAELGKETGMSAKGGQSSTGAKVTSQVQKALEAGRIPIETELNSLYTLITQKTGKALGGAGADMENLMATRLTHLKELPELFYEKLKDTTGFARLSDQLGKLLEGLDPESPRGKRIFADLELAFNHIADIMAGFDLAGTVEAGIDALDLFATEFIDLLSVIPGETGRKAGEVAARMKERRLEQARKEGEEQAKQEAAEAEKESAARASKTEAGFFKDFPANERADAIRKGLYNAADDETPWLVKKGEGATKTAEAAGEEIGKATIRGTRKSLKMQSPSRVMQDLADQTTDSFADRVRANANDAADAMGAIVSLPGRRGGMGGGITLHITIAPNITIGAGAGSVDELASMLAPKLASMTVAEIRDALEQIAMQTGSAAA